MLIALVCAVMISFVATIGMAADEQVLQGTVQQSEAGLVIVIEDVEYIVAGQDLSEMVGKQVVVTGTVTESDEGKTINVLEAQPIE